jgi:hypothetical protein
MTFATTSVFYLTFGVGVAAALVLRGAARTPGQRLFRAAAAILFWPLYVPLLLERPAASSAEVDREATAAEPADSLARAIAQVECELDAALGSLDGWAENVLVDERERLNELRTALRSQANRVRELDRFLAPSDVLATETAVLPANGPAVAPCALPNDRRTRSERGRLENIRRLQALRSRMFDDLLATLAWVRELVTMIHLAKFSGAPASRAEELVSQIAAAVEGLREASNWCESPVANQAGVEDAMPPKIGQGIGSRRLVTPA